MGVLHLRPARVPAGEREGLFAVLWNIRGIMDV